MIKRDECEHCSETRYVTTCDVCGKVIDGGTGIHVHQDALGHGNPFYRMYDCLGTDGSKDGEQPADLCSWSCLSRWASERGEP